MIKKKVDHAGRGFISSDPDWPNKSSGGADYPSPPADVPAVAVVEDTAAIQEIATAEAVKAPPVHVMLDLETWDTASTAVIIAIGATAFDPNRSELGESFYVVVDPRVQIKCGRTISADTMLWWMDAKQDTARADWLRSWSEERTDLVSALYAFEEWYEKFPPLTPVWGNGANFDNVILRSAYKGLQQECPFNGFLDRCFRTLKSIQGAKHVEPINPFPHDALFDSQHQARWAQAIAKEFMLKL